MTQRVLDPHIARMPAPGTPMTTSRGAVTIGVPVFNGERHIAQTLDSLLAQDYPCFEVVVADNASTDRTLEIVESIASMDERVRVVRRDRNIGGAANYSDLARRASTPYFKWASADDLCAPTFLSQCVAALEANPSAVLANPKTLLIDAESEVICPWDADLHIVHPDVAVRFREFILRRTYANPIFGVIRTAALHGTALVLPYPSSDFVTLVELLLRGDFVSVPAPLFLRRWSPTSPGEHSRASKSHIADWYKPGSRPSAVPPAVRQYWDFQRAIARAPVGTRDRMRAVMSCWGAVALRQVNRRAGIHTFPEEPDWEGLRPTLTAAEVRSRE